VRADEANQLTSKIDRTALMEHLRDYNDDPQGVVFTQLDADEWPGALALAAGRFEGLAFPSVEPAPETSIITVAESRALADRVRKELSDWDLPREGRSCYVTLAGDFPLRDRGYSSSNDYTYPNTFNPFYGPANPDQKTANHIWAWGINRLIIEDNTFADAFICSYSANHEAFKATFNVLFGKSKPKGKLPVYIPGLASFGFSLDQQNL